MRNTPRHGYTNPMPPSDTPSPPFARPTASPFWKWLMRLSGTLAILLFLTPSFYVIKYYAVDLPRERAIARPNLTKWLGDPQNPDSLLAEVQAAKRPAPKEAPTGQNYRVQAVREMGKTLRQPSMGWRRPMEALSAKAALAELAAHCADPSVKAAAAEELRKLAVGGATLNRER